MAETKEMIVTTRTEDGKNNVSTHFKYREYACKDGSEPIIIAKALVNLLENIRVHFNAPVTITSGYRTPAHNKAVGGRPLSYHMKGMAADIQVKNHTSKEVAEYASKAFFKQRHADHQHSKRIRKLDASRPNGTDHEKRDGKQCKNRGRYRTDGTRKQHRYRNRKKQQHRNRQKHERQWKNPRRFQHKEGQKITLEKCRKKVYIMSVPTTHLK